jgi:HSP20 family protein
MFITMRPAPVVESILDLERSLDGMFDRVLSPMQGRAVLPGMDVLERGDDTLVVLELPGVRKEDLSIVVKDGFLTVSGERKPSGSSEKSSVIRSEIAYGKFRRSIELPHAVDLNGVNAELVNGILQVTLPKAAEARPRQISVK